VTVPSFLLRDHDADASDDRGRRFQPANPPASRRSALALSEGILDRLRQREEAAYVELLHVAFHVLVRFSYGIVYATDTAHDIVQDVMCKVWEQGERFAPHGSVEAYLYTAVRNESLKVGRAREIRKRHEPRVLDASVTPSIAVDDALVADELVQAYHRALSLLTERQRTAFVLRYRDERTVAEVAGILGVTLRAAERLLARATDELRVALRPFRT
jgi:RNA polymerase sigma-70 factor (ECF subfamily)